MEDPEKTGLKKILFIFAALKKPMTMIRITVVSVMLLLAGFSAFPQEKIQVRGTGPDLYLDYLVMPGDTWFSIGRLFNISPREMVPYNATSMDKPLKAGSLVKVPLIGSNFTQEEIHASDEVLVPLYHTVQEKEWMYRISVNHNKVPVDKLEKWNAVTNDKIRPGMNLVVGYLKVKPGVSALASRSVRKIPGESNPNAAIANSGKPTPPPAPVKQAVIHNEEKKDSATDSGKGLPASYNKPEPEEPKKVVENINHHGGFFRSQYHQGGNAGTGNAGIFKSTSGWDDGKYYALMNNVAVGTIIKITFPSTQKSIYAKVLGQLPEMKESQGLTVRLSDAAASELGVAISKFYVEVSY